MHIHPQLNDIDDCLYRVAIRAMIIQGNKVLLVKEKSDDWWALPGGGVDHGETVESSLIREIVEELGVPAAAVSCDFVIAYYDIGNVVNTIPRMNLFFKVSLSKELLGKTDHIVRWKWFTKDEFLQSDISPSYDKIQLASVIFGE